ncbi:glycosyltransferase, partial [Parvibaculum sp.]|uniref:glycosyltransferase n=1 Tax=Parvibaculum sp. TaxID=2024848 RepID=UPI002CE2E9CF
DARFLIVGAGPEVARHAGFSADDPRIRYLGHRPDALDLYAVMDCLVVPSREEPFGPVAIEAMRAGCRLIVHNSHGLADIAATNPEIDAIDTTNPDELVAALERAYRLRGIAPRYDMTLYAPDARVADVEAFYRDLLKARTKARRKAMP